MTVSIFSSYSMLLNRRDPYQQVGIGAHREQNSVTNTNPFLLAKMFVPLNPVSYGQRKLLTAWFLVNFSRVQLVCVEWNSVHVVYIF